VSLVVGKHKPTLNLHTFNFGKSHIERSLFAFIWKYSKRDQLVLLLVTLTLMPLLYVTLELPKRIINDAIGGDASVTYFGITLSQVQFLLALCGLFLVAVLVHGIMKMRINTKKGVLAERLLRRFRYTLIARVLRFPAPYFERTSQGELVSMVTAESEPMGGFMGDAVAQPVLQAGQMLTILFFLFSQSITFGLAACALIPLQAWLIPRMQKKINLLNKKRIIQIRALAAEIGESATGSTALRTNGGWRYRLAMISDRLGRLYAIRFEIFQKKFFMKFINNFITQLTPFFFYSIGGYLTITGEITIGALVAALAAYKELASPWKELLTYYTQSQDMALRWETITERFAPTGMIDEDLFDTIPKEMPTLRGDIELRNVTVLDEDGNTVLDSLDVTFPAGKSVAITASSDEDRRALADLLTRELIPSSGKVVMAGLELSTLHQATISSRIGHAAARPVMFMGTFGGNVFMPLKYRPLGEAVETPFGLESVRAGNTAEALDAEWLDMTTAGVEDQSQLRAWFLKLVKSMGSADVLFRRTLEQRFDPAAHEALSKALVELRPSVAKAVHEAGLAQHAWILDPDKYNPALPIAENLIYATPRRPITAEILAEQTDFLKQLATLDLENNLLELAVDIVEMLRQTFDLDGTDHPLFRKLGLDVETYEQAVALISKHRDQTSLTQLEKAQLLAVPFVLSAEKIGPAFPNEIIERVLEIRRTHGKALQTSMSELFTPIDVDMPIAGFTVLENALFGKVLEGTGKRREKLGRVVANVLHKARLSELILELIFEMPVALGGANFPAMFAEPLALSRATIKRPDILILDGVLASNNAAAQISFYNKLRKLLPDATIICLAPSFEGAAKFDCQFEMQKGRLMTDNIDVSDDEDGSVGADLTRKLRALEQTELFSSLDRKQLRLLAFGARWFSAKDGEYVFRKNDDPTNGAYLIVKGTAELMLPQESGDDTLIVTSGVGELVGELGLIKNEPRSLDMRAKGELTCLRIGAEEFLAVVENDAATAFKLLQVVSGYITN
jgi:ABC-type multidrug transport system fused ATPase/permease subunit